MNYIIGYRLRKQREKLISILSVLIELSLESSSSSSSVARGEGEEEEITIETMKKLAAELIKSKDDQK